jgi:hypothetical protein
MKPKRSYYNKSIYYGRCDITNKLIYLSKADARKAIKRIKKESNLDNRSYQCPFCDGYHLTSQKKK